MLQIETTNVCNAACIFCAYPGLKRKKGVMSLPLFEKIIGEYEKMGGTAVSLTPVVGDAFLDPHLIDRIRMIKAHPGIKQISVTTNGIALNKYSDEDLLYVLESLSCIQVSIGGLYRATYTMMYGVDKFDQVHASLERLMKLKSSVSSAANLTFAFRTTDWKFMGRFKKQIQAYRRQGVFISHMWAYGNYGELVKKGGKHNLMVFEKRPDKNKTCIYPSIHAAICWDGKVTACACTDLECAYLRIGNVEEEGLAEILSGKKRTGMLDSFEKNVLTDLCRKCSAYRPDTAFAHPCFREVHAGRPLPLDFFHYMMT